MNNVDFYIDSIFNITSGSATVKSRSHRNPKMAT